MDNNRGERNRKEIAFAQREIDSGQATPVYALVDFAAREDVSEITFRRGADAVNIGFEFNDGDIRVVVCHTEDVTGSEPRFGDVDAEIRIREDGRIDIPVNRTGSAAEADRRGDGAEHWEEEKKKQMRP